MRTVVWILCLCLSYVVADEAPSIRLPLLPDVKEDPEPPRPVQVTDLQAERLYIIESDVQCIVLASRNGYVTITPEKGPIRFRGKFADGPDVFETRTYEGPWIYSIEPVNPGQIELLVVPQGATETADVIRRTLSVMGSGPIPPPKPTPGPPGPAPTPEPPEPEPTPEPEPSPVPGDAKRVLIVYESQQLTELPPTQTVQFTSGTLRKYLQEKCSKAEDGTPEFRIWDKDVNTNFVGPVWQEALKLRRESLPWLIVSNGVSGYSGPLPDTEAKTITILKRYLE